MMKKILILGLTAILLCAVLCSCGCEAETTLDSIDVAKENITRLVQDYGAALKGSDVNAYNQLCTENMQIKTDDEKTNYFDKVENVIIQEISLDSVKQTGASYELLVHYYITFSQDYTGTDYKPGINNMTERFVIKKTGNAYKVDNILPFGS